MIGTHQPTSFAVAHLMRRYGLDEAAARELLVDLAGLTGLELGDLASLVAASEGSTWARPGAG